MPAPERVIFEYSRPGRGAVDQWPREVAPGALADLPAKLRRTRPLELPEVGELEVVRHFTRLSQLNFSIDTHFYPPVVIKILPVITPKFVRAMLPLVAVALSA